MLCATKKANSRSTLWPYSSACSFTFSIEIIIRCYWTIFKFKELPQIHFKESINCLLMNQKDELFSAGDDGRVHKYVYDRNSNDFKFDSY